MNRRVLRILPLVALVLLAVAVWASGAPRYLHIAALREHAATLRGLVRDHPVLAPAAYVVVLAATTATCLPGAIPVLMLAGGFLFGIWEGAAAATAGLTLGSALAFVAVRSSLGTALRDAADRSGGRLKTVLDGVRSGAFGYVLTLRLIPIAPFELMSIAAALAGIPFRPYLLGTALGVTPATFIYSAIGVGIGRLFDRGETPRLRTLLTPGLVVPLLALGLLSLAATVVVRRRARAKAAAPSL
ncbi:MAG TPA: VTT domain-containing protein [Caulobacteraceae bacterium]|nr:VTT domain-containing protein [Caulobacteraceae bacterium]